MLVSEESAAVAQRADALLQSAMLEPVASSGDVGRD